MHDRLVAGQFEFHRDKDGLVGAVPEKFDMPPFTHRDNLLKMRIVLYPFASFDEV